MGAARAVAGAAVGVAGDDDGPGRAAGAEQVGALVARARAGDLDAFNRLVERYQDAIFGAAYALLRDRRDAEDAAQEAFVQAWRSLDALREPERFPAWLYRIVRNRCLNAIARDQHRAAKVVPLERAGPVREVAPEGAAVEVREALGALSEPNRLATTLYYIGGYSVAEVAALLDVPPGTVKRRLHDARRQLRAALLDTVREDLRAGRPSQDTRFAGVVAIVNAAWTGDVARVKALLRELPALADAPDHRGWRPLHHAARRGHAGVVSLLLAHRADPDPAEEALGWTPLHLATEHRHQRVVDLLEAHGARLGIVGAAGLGRVERVAALLADDAGLVRDWGAGTGPLHWAAYYGHAAVVRLLLARGAEVDARSRNAFANTALHCAVLRGHAGVARLLVAAGADVHARDAQGGTPLHLLAKYPGRDPSLGASDEAIVELLLAAGAAIDGANEAGETPLHWAATRGDRAVARHFLARGAALDLYAAAGLGDVPALAALLDAAPGGRSSAIDAHGPGGLTPLHFAAWGDSPAAAEYLLARGADLHAPGGPFGGTPLHLAAWERRPAMVALLLGAGADPNARDAQGWTPLHLYRAPEWAPRQPGAPIAGLLLARGAAIDATNHARETPLHRAAHAGDKAVVELLLAYGANVNAADQEGRTPLHRAALREHYGVGELLARYGGDERPGSQGEGRQAKGECGG